MQWLLLMLPLRVLVRAAQCTRRLFTARRRRCVSWALEIDASTPINRRGDEPALFDALHRISAEPVLISQDPSGNRDDAIERVTRRGLPKRGVALVTLELAA